MPVSGPAVPVMLPTPSPVVGEKGGTSETSDSTQSQAKYLLTRRRPDEQTEDRAAVAVGPERSGCPIECAVDALQQRAPRRLAVSAVEVMQGDQRPAGRDFEDRATAAVTARADPACGSRTVEVTIVGLNQPGTG